jgi:hypothetical protein
MTRRLSAFDPRRTAAAQNVHVIVLSSNINIEEIIRS